MTMKHFTAAALIAAAFALAGCNTVAGLGQDLKKGSEHVSAALGKAGINIRMISQGPDELNIIVGVNNDDFESCVRVLYNSFVK